MEITRQLYQLQELDIEIEKMEQSLAFKTGRLGKRETLDAAGEKLAAAQHHLDELKHQRRDAEGQVEDLLSKIQAAEQQLYGGKVTNSKELTSLQHEVNSFKSRGDALQDNALGLIEFVEAAEKDVAAAGSEYNTVEEDWRRQQKQLTGDIEQLQTSLANLKQERGHLAGKFDATVMALYEKLRRQKKQAVARVERGICCTCRISQSASALQRARGGQPVQCGSCGRILFIA